MPETNQQAPQQSPAPAPLPPELADAAAGLRAGTSNDEEQPAAAKVPTGSPHAGGDAQEFACHIHSYLRQYIEFSDKKATFVFAIDAALLIYMYQQGLQARWLKPLSTWLASDLFVFLSTLALFGGALACALVIAPRFVNSHRGFVYFGSIAEYESASDYSSSIFKQPRLGLTDALLKHNYDLSRVCKTKFRILTAGIWLSVIGSLIAIAALVVGIKPAP